MNILFRTFIAVVLLPIGAAANAACEFKEEADGTLHTDWVEPKRYGIKVSAITAGENKQLGLQFGVSDYYLIPNFDPRDPQRQEKMNSWVRTIKRNALGVPAGSMLRITFSDMTSLELKSVGDVASEGYSEAPGHPDNPTSNYRINAFAAVAYALPPDDLEMLTKKIPIKMRLEAKARYYSLGSWDEKGGQVIQDTMKCLQ